MSLSISKRSLTGSAVAVPETHRIQADREITAIQNHLDGQLRAALNGLPILSDQKAKQELADTILSIHRSWTDMKGAAIRTGKLLLKIHRQGHDVYDALFRQEKSILPFGRSVEVKLRRIAEDLEIGRFDETNLPVAYSAAYELTTLTDDQLSLAKERGLVRPETIRKEIIEFKREVTVSGDATEDDAPLQKLKSRRTALERKRQKLVAALRKLDTDLANINKLLNTPYQEEAA